MNDNQERWIKLHLKILDNPVFYRDHTGLVLFIWCLLRSYPQGTFITGRFLMAEAVGLKPSTAYKALKRLEKYGFVNTSSDNKFTTVSICNWDKYQSVGNTSSDNKVTTKGQQSNNKVTQYNKVLENKNIELDNINTPLPPKGEVAMSEETREDWNYWEKTIAPITRNIQFQRNALVRLRRVHGIDRLHKMIRLAGAAHVEKYAPKDVKCNSPADLEKKWDALVIWGKAKFEKDVARPYIPGRPISNQSA